ncbi:amidohydrolase family protein [Microbacterium sp. LWH7-1.2]|uniref:amidohydrolase n=1 Tax=Microbacterium sp. LWH7-1.2 TaxID=3135257 RepID=UPI00313964B1
MARPVQILLGGNILTLDEASSRATAIAWRDGEIIAVGSDRDVLERTSADPGEAVQLEGRTVIPGLTDAHAHLDRYSLGAELPGFEHCETPADVLDVIAAAVADREPGEWIVTRPIGAPPRYEQSRLGEGSLVPTRAELDRVAPNNPVFIRSIWGYWNMSLNPVSVANTAALRAAGVDLRDTPSPSAAVEMLRDGSGELTGVFVESVRHPIVEHTLLRAAPGFTAAQRARSIAEGAAAYASYGTTAYFEGHGVADDLLDAYALSGAGGLRATLIWSPNWTEDDPAAVGGLVEQRRRLLRAKDAKLDLQGIYVEFDDGTGDATLRARGRRQSGWAGFTTGAGLPEQRMRELLQHAAEAGIRVCGIDIRLLPLIAEVDAVTPVAPLRWVLAHHPVLSSEQIQLIARLGMVVTTVAPHFLLHGDGSFGGPDEGDFLPLPALIEAGVPFAFGSDNVPITMWESIYAVTERLTAGGVPVSPENALTREQALVAATRGGAWLTREETTRGALARGQAADLAVLDRDPLTCSAADLRATQAVATVVAGTLVHGTL